MHVGFIGLGNMGGPMAANVLARGFDLTIYNRTKAKTGELASKGARVADSPAELTRAVDIVLTCLSTIEASLEVFLGEGGVVAAARPGQILVDHATVDQRTSRKVYDAAREKGVSFLDAPISGGPGGARDATLAIMVGGDEAPFGSARPVFEAMGKTVLHMGACGAGTATKLANQLLVGVHSLASCEALLLARNVGVDLEKLIHVLERSWGASRMLERNAPNIISESFGPSAAPIRNLDKDLSIIQAMAKENGLDLPALNEAARVYSRLTREGKGEWDITAATCLLHR